MVSAHAVKFLHDTHSTLKVQDDLSPRNAIVNSTLTGLVKCLTAYHDAGIGNLLSTAEELVYERQQLPKLCGSAEGEMEEHWARHFIAKSNLQIDDLKEFWYYDNYHALWNLEDHLIGRLNTNRYVFLGSGPLPLTAIMAALKNPDLQLICVDYDAQACDLSDDLIRKLNLSDRITVTQAAATNYAYQDNDFVICASLITEKEKLYPHLYQAGIKDFIVRDAEGAYCYLYAPSTLPPKNQYRELRCTIPNKMCINTTRYFSRSSEAA